MMQTAPPIKKDKKRPLFIRHTTKTNGKPMFAVEIQKLLGLVLFPQQFSNWPNWCLVKKPGLIKSTVILLIDRVTNIDAEDQVFSKMFGEPYAVYNPNAYAYSWNEEIMKVPRMFLNKTAVKLADERQSLLAPPPRSLKNGMHSRLGQTTTTLAETICSDSGAPSVGKCKPSASRSTGGGKRNAALSRTPFIMPDVSASDVFDRTTLLMSLQQMQLERVPLPPELNAAVGEQSKRTNRTDDIDSEFVPSKGSYLPVSSSSPMFAVDCEMVSTRVGNELARVTMVDEVGCVVFDRLVQPPNPVEDYLTRFSGITRDMLAPITTALADVQREISDLLPADAILVGHSIENDLHALKIFHPYLIDTSVVYNLKGSRTAKVKLRFLAEHFLGRMIQTGSRGHSSAEDAIATMDLVRLKLSQNISFGDVTTSWRFPEDYYTLPPSKQSRLQGSDSARVDDIPTEQSPSGHSSSKSITHHRLLNQMNRIPDRFRHHVTELISSYASTAEGGTGAVDGRSDPSFHFVQDLVQPSSLPFHYQESKVNRAGDSQPTCNDSTDFPSTNSIAGGGGEAESEMRVSKSCVVQLKALACQKRLVICRIACSVDWSPEKCQSKIAKFCKRLYRELPKHCLLGILCTGDGCHGDETTLDTGVPLETAAVKSSCYFTLTEEEQLTTAVNTDSSPESPDHDE